MSQRKYLVLFRNKPTGGQSSPSPEQMQQMFLAYNAWKEKFKDDILDMGDKLKSEGRVVTAIRRGGRALRRGQGSGRRLHDCFRRDYDGAVEVVRACPAVHAPGASLEIREMTGAKM